MGQDIVAVLNMFLDPAGAVQRIDRKWIWAFPLALLAMVSVAIGWVMVPLTMRIMLRTPEMKQAAQMAETFSRVGVFVTPVMVLLLTLILAGLLLVSCQVLSISAKFPQLFNLVAMASIVKVVQSLAAFAVIQLKGDEIQTLQELSPPFGLDIFLPEGANRFLMTTLNYFSVFQIWFLVVIALGLAAFTNSSKGKAFIAITPLWLFPLLLALAGAIFRR